jgi:hypothetical protein
VLTNLPAQQRRVLTVREVARAQGFSDTTDFKSTSDTAESEVSVLFLLSHGNNQQALFVSVIFKSGMLALFLFQWRLHELFKRYSDPSHNCTG